VLALPTRDILAADFLPQGPAAPVEWTIFESPVAYEDAVRRMEARAEAIAQHRAAEAVFLLEHPPLYTAGTSARSEDLLERRFPVFATGRGGQFTYHGPGQRVAYVMLDLKRRKPDLRAYVAALEAWIIAALAEFNVKGERREDRVGVWVRRPDKAPGPAGDMAEDKIAAIGIRVRRWVSFHGIALNVDPDLAHFAGIVPCGVASTHYGVTSLADLDRMVSLPEVDQILRREFEAIFGSTITAPAELPL
jgi:lipoyl(octanoyl) transferase